MKCCYKKTIQMSLRKKP